MQLLEANIDGLVGPTHNYAGLSFGNVASEKYALSRSNPKEAALQGLKKIKFLHDLGLPQLVMPPQPRPDLRTLYNLGYKKIDDAPVEIVSQIYSASSMWTANAATISPSIDTADGKVHITPANLLNKFHRSIEARVTANYLKQIFSGSHFVHHEPLTAHAMFSDEGAANHMRLFTSDKKKGTEIFVYGGATKKYPPRQSLHAFQAIARLHRLDPKKTVFLRQSPHAIDAGVFHNDVIAMSNGPLFIYHEKAYQDFNDHIPGDFTLIKIKDKELSVKDAVSTYFFNSQIVTLPSGKMAIIAPEECNQHARARKCFLRLVSEGHIDAVHYFDLRESMKNGGGPACLRLRVPLTQEEMKSVKKNIWLNNSLFHALCRWIEKHYRDRMLPNDLYDPLLIKESQAAMADLYTLLKMESA